MFFGFLSGFLWICECLGTPFSLLTSVPLVLKPILTFSKGRNKLLYFVKDFFSQSLQPPLVLPRRGDAGYSGSVKDWLMQVTLVLSKTGWCWLLLLLINHWQSGGGTVTIAIDKTLTIWRIQTIIILSIIIMPIIIMPIIIMPIIIMPRVTIPPLRGRLGGGWWQLAE